MANKYRGEVDAIINGETIALCLTLGALAELEARLGVADLQALGERLSNGQIAMKDVLEILRAGLIGAGYRWNDEQIATMQIEGGPSKAVQLVAQLLALTFGEPKE